MSMFGFPNASTAPGAATPPAKLRVVRIPGGASVRPDSDSADLFMITGQTQNLTIQPPTGTPNEGQTLELYIRSSASAWDLTWANISGLANFVGSSVMPLPGRLEGSVPIHLLFRYHAAVGSQVPEWRLVTRSDGVPQPVPGGILPVAGTAGWDSIAPRYPLMLATGSTSMGGSVSILADKVHAWPFTLCRTATLDQLSVGVTTAAASTNCIFGIYTAASTSLYPATKIIDSGSVSCATTGAKEVSVSQVLTAGTLYWIVFSVSSFSLAFTSCSVAGTFHSPSIFGYTDAVTLTTYGVINAARVFDGTLPSSYPAGATRLQTAIPIVFGRFNA